MSCQSMIRIGEHERNIAWKVAYTYFLCTFKEKFVLLDGGILDSLYRDQAFDGLLLDSDSKSFAK